MVRAGSDDGTIAEGCVVSDIVEQVVDVQSQAVLLVLIGGQKIDRHLIGELSAVASELVRY